MFESLLILVHLVLIGIGLYALIWRSDEIPLIIVFAVSYFGFYRYGAIVFGLGHLIDITGLYNLGTITDDELLSALGFMTLGEAVMVGGYLIFKRHVAQAASFSSEERMFSANMVKVVMRLAWLILGIALVADVAVGSIVSGGSALAFGYGYLTHLSFLKIGIAIVLFQLYLAGALQTHGQKALFYSFFGLLFIQSFQPGQRYQFFGWMLGVALLWSYQSFGMTRVAKLSAALVSIMLFVGAAGALRAGLEDRGTLSDSALTRVIAAEDANMLEGFALLTKVYPELLSYRWGGGHVEILYRPIPRAIWPDKPKGGYFFAVAANNYDFEERGTTGFSPSLFGSFYEEGGVLAVLIFSALYGIGFAKLANWANTHGLLISGLVRASLAGGLVPLLRGGDLPGVAAWVGFSFLAVGLYVYYVKKRLLRARVGLALQRF